MATATESARRVHVREVLVGLEVALSSVLLVVGGLLLLSFLKVVAVDRGFETTRIITQDVSYLSPKYARGARRLRIEETVARISQIPGVEIAAAINRLPLRGSDWVSELEDPKQPRRPVETQAVSNFRFVTPAYWQAMGIPLKRGRLLNDSDKDHLRAVISERAAQYLWPAENPLGRYVRGVGPASPSLEVVGVVGEVRAKDLEQDPPMIVYEHYWRMQPIAMSYVARTRGTQGAGVAKSIRAELTAMDPEMAIVRPWTMEEIVGESVATRRFQMYLALSFAACALLLACLGVYGVISYTVARRTPEIGIRTALGASGRDVMLTVLARGMCPVAVGVGIGLAGALLASRAIASQLFQVAPWDPPTFAGVAVLIATVAMGACWRPARRAARIDPVQALRFE
jgi:predicted permease